MIMPTSFSFPIVGDVLACVGKATPNVIIDWPALDEPGLPNILKSTAQAVIAVQLQFINFVAGWIDKIKKNAKALADAITDLKKWPAKVITEIVKNFMAEFKMPDIAKMIRDWITQVSGKVDEIKIPDIISMLANILTNIVLKGMSINTALTSEMQSFISPIYAALTNAQTTISDVAGAALAKIAQARETVAKAVNAVQMWIEKYIKMIVLFISIPGLLLKAIFEYLLEKFMSILAGFSGMMSSIIKTLDDAVKKMLSDLGFVSPVETSLATPPVLTLIVCLLKALVNVITGFPGNVGSLSALLPK